MSREVDGNVRLTSREEMMIRLLNRHNPGEADGSPCLSDGEIAAFMDGTLDEGERRRVVCHLSSCPECREILSETMRTADAVGERRASRRKKALMLLIPSAVAASVLLFLAADNSGKKSAIPRAPNRVATAPLPVTAPGSASAERSSPDETAIRREKRLYPSVAEVAAALEKTATSDRLADFPDEPAYFHQGFSGGVSRARTLFRAGARLTGLELAIRGADRERIVDHLTRLAALFHADEEGRRPERLCKEALKIIESGRPTRNISGIAGKLENCFTEKNDTLLLSFGAWVEGGRIAAHFSDAGIFSATTVARFQGGLSKAGAPPGVAGPLKEIGEILAGGAPGRSELGRIELLLESVRDMM